MARRIQVVIDDDLTGGPADETVTFGIDGVTYEIDLSARNADKLRSSLEPFVKAGRKASGGRRRTSSTKATGPASNASEVRAWAQANGVPVSARGRVAADVVAKFEAAQG